jgi:hypothetical protein
MGYNGRIVQRDRLAVIPELAVAEVTVPLDVKPARPPQGDVFSCGKMELLAGWQHMIEVDIGMEGDLVRGADVVAHLLEQSVRLLSHHRHGRIRPVGLRLFILGSNPCSQTNPAISSRAAATSEVCSSFCCSGQPLCPVRFRR